MKTLNHQAKQRPPRCSVTIADVFVELGLASTPNDVRICCVLGSAKIDDAPIQDWQQIVKPESLKGKTLQFISRKHVCGSEMDLLGFGLI